ncbi:MAG: YeeE/YedE thiosulfate transporter family protein, partial [Oscillospiraceae bacterium]|nr:YeeE/YedE thiosulfate transporter family protein [Oscillospiraceae bacterium]
MQQTKTAGITLPAKPGGTVKAERIIAAVVLIAAVLLGKLFLAQGILFRLAIGLALGYALSRAYTGFAGSVNRAYRAGSTKLMRAMMLMFLVSSILTAGLLYGAEAPENYGLWVNPINLGLLVGGLLFGFGMALSSCCASGVLTDLSSGFSRAFVTLIFFGIGVFLGFPIQNTASWVKQSWFVSPVGEATSGGVFLPDWFQWDGFKGYLGAIILTALICGIVVVLAYRYEKKRKLSNTYTGIDTEVLQEQSSGLDSKSFKLFSENTYQKLFVKPWTLMQGAIV